MFKLIKKVRAWVRIHIWGFCPECNSDAPYLYDCEICGYDTGSPFSKKRRRELWVRWKEFNQ